MLALFAGRYWRRRATDMADANEKPMVSIDPRYLLTGDVVDRPPDERPKHDTIETILDWLAGPPQQIPSPSGAFDEFA
jgi:hypothetical protein